MTILQRWKNTALHNKALVWASALVAFGTLFYAGAAVFQICMMNRLAKETSIQTDRLICKADKISNSIGTMVIDNESALKENRDAIQTTLTENRNELAKVLGQNRDSLNASVSQGKAALDASIESSHTDQRPWVSIVRWKLSEDPSSGKDFAIIIGPINTGKTPALSVTAISQLSIWPEEPSPTDLEAVVVKAGKMPNSIGMLPPSVGATILDFHYATDPWRLDANQVEAYRAKTQRIYLETLVKYTDAFGWKHRTRVCAYHSYGMPLDELSLCQQGNSMDDH